MFTGKLTGEFIALDQETGRTVWQFKTGSSINSTAITYAYGRQYVSIASGLGGWTGEPLRRRQDPDRRLDVDVRADGRLMPSMPTISARLGVSRAVR